MQFKLVYGNHGKDPFHIMDTLLLVKLGLESLGHKADLEAQMTPGRTNILLECFNYDFVEAMKDVAATPGTEFIIIGTEFATGQTFNDFKETGDDAGEADSHYDLPHYWKKRFRTFLLAQQRARAIWHLAEDQVEPFRRATQHEHVHYLPHGYVDGFARVRQKPAEHKDFDAIFTGTLTRYRHALVQQLEARGVRTLATKPLNFVQREDLVARARIGLNMRLNERWRYPSNSRYHFHLSNESLLVSEHCELKCDLSPYVVEAGPDDFVERCLEMLAGDRWQREARARTERFMAAMPMPRLMERLLDATYDKP